MAGWGLLPPLLLLLFVIAIELSSSSPMPPHEMTNGETQPQPRSTSIPSPTGNAASPNYKDAVASYVADNDDDCDTRNDCRTTEMPCKDEPTLPNLRSSLDVTNIRPMSATVNFEGIDNSDNGGKPPGSRLFYLLHVWEYKKNGSLFEEKLLKDQRNWTNTDYYYHTLRDLTPNTTYHVQVLVGEKVDGQTCLAEVKNTTFKTPCPVPPAPNGLQVESVSSNSFKVQWKAVANYPRQCSLQYILRALKVSASKQRENGRFSVTGVECVIPNLEAYTLYSVEIYSFGGGSFSTPTKTRVKTSSVEPGEVTKLQVEPNGTSTLVTWDDPKDNHRRGELESFEVSWGPHKVTTGWKTRNVGLRKKFVIKGLSPNTTYDIKVQAKNKHVLQRGAASLITTTTTVGVPSRVEELKVLNASVSLLTVSWRNPTSNTGIITFYNVSLRPAESAVATAAATPPWNKIVTITQAEFDGLDAGTQYTVQVKACNIERCGDAGEERVWTYPTPPRLEESVDLVETTEATVTIQLPRLTNPPGWHYVMVEREGTRLQTTDAEVLMERAVALIASEGENEASRIRRSADLSGTGSEMYIAAKVKQEGDERLQMTVGDNNTYGRYHNHPLEKGAAYWMLTVTETRSGPWAARLSSVPRRFVAAPSTPALEGLWLAAGMAAGVLLVTVVAIVCIKRRHRLRAKLVRAHIGNDSPVPASRPEPFFLLLEHHNDGERGPPMRKEPTGYPYYSNHDSQDPAKEDIYANVTLQVPQKDLETYLLRAVMSAESKEEFAQVPSLLSSNFSACNLPENRGKNRYKNNVTYDETRVVLPLHDNIPHTDYINANFIEGPGSRHAFIATQGPKDKTVGAFWRMVWHTQCTAIVMLAKTTERGKVKVAQYWPEKQPLLAEGVTVTPGGVTKTMDFVIRTFGLSVSGVQRQVTHYQYITWPDHGVPDMAYGLAHMLKMVCRDHDGHLPITVHCSAGIGRTGTVLLALYLWKQLKAQGNVNPIGALSALRRGRGMQVENIEQYVFAHQLLHEMLFGLDTSFPSHSFGEQLPALRTRDPPDGVSPLQRQFKKLKSLPKDMSFKYGKDLAVAHLNRNKDILPADCRLLFVQSLGNGLESRYLNVVRINGADMKDAYIAGEHPQKHTLAKMWKLVHEREIGAWLMVHNFPPDDQEFPRVVCDSSALQDNITLTASELRNFDHYDEQEVTVGMPSQGEVSNQKCVLLTLKGWPADRNLPTSPEPLLSLIERAVAIPAYQQILITCRDGVVGCGVVAALLVALGRTKLAREVDIYRAAASVMNDRPQFIVDQEQYEFLHHAMDAFLNSERHYNYD